MTTHQYKRRLAIVQPEQIEIHFETSTFVCPPPDKELKDDIEDNGILIPVIVCEHPDYAYWVVKNGQRRVLAAIELEEEVPTLIYEGIHPDDTLAWIPILNDVGSANPLHNLYAVQESVRLGRTMEEIRTEFRMTKKQVYNVLRLGQLPRPIVDGIKDGQIVMKTGLALASKIEKYPDIAQDAVDEYAKTHKLSGTWVADYSRKQRTASVRSLFERPRPGAHKSEAHNRYAIFNSDGEFVTTADGFNEGRSAAMMAGKDAELYKLTPVKF